MNTTELKGLKILKNKYLIIIFSIIGLIVLLICILNYNSKFVSTRFYYLNYNNKIDYEKQFLPKNFDFNELFYYYFSGGRNRKKFPLFFIDSKFINGYYIKKDTLCISLNHSGYKEYKKIKKETIEKICKAILITFNKSGKKSLDNLSLIYNTYMELYKFKLKK